VSPQASTAYLAQLGKEQAKLAAAEQRIPAKPRTPAALSRSIALLAGAIGQLRQALAKITPPAPVSAAHKLLIAIMHDYAARLTAAAGAATRPGGELGAANELLAATNTASSAFSATISQIHATLKR
jgi:hypothetical protein